MKLLLHICCCPCSISCIDKLKKDDIDVVGYWYNPNIHPFTEYKMRRDTLKTYSKMINLDVIYNDYYGLRDFCKNVINNIDNRCGYCYYSRLDEVAKKASELGYEYFSTTLLISPYQNHELVKKTGLELANKYGIKFYYEDFRPYYKESYDRARELGLYTQKYCGCIFSEEDRYKTNFSYPGKKVFNIKKLTKKDDYYSYLSGNDYILNNIDSCNVYGLIYDDKLVCFAVSLPHDDVVELLYIHTISQYRKMGYAKKLLKLLPFNFKHKYKKLIVGTDAKNAPLFIKSGFDNYENTINNLSYYSKTL